MPEALLHVGALRGPHGLHGWVKAALTLDNPQLLLQTPVQLADGRTLTVVTLKPVGQGLMGLQLEGISTPEAAAMLKGPLYLPRTAIPVAADEVLLANLVGRPLLAADGNVAGTISAIRALPAGPALEINVPGRKTSALIPIVADFLLLEAEDRVTLTELGKALLTI
jgi:ribosomal 30S subunit maturation factor RimM